MESVIAVVGTPLRFRGARPLLVAVGRFLRPMLSKESGSDIADEAARERHPDASIEVRDILLDRTMPRYDFVVCSGAFHVKLEATDAQWRDYTFDVIRQMFAMCDVGIAFNLMTDQVDFRADGLHYAHPGEIMEFCRRELSRFVTLRHDYPLYEFTTYVYK